MIDRDLLAFLVHYVLLALVSSSTFRIFSNNHESILIKDNILLLLQLLLLSEISLFIYDVKFLFFKVEVLFLQIIF